MYRYSHKASGELTSGVYFCVKGKSMLKFIKKWSERRRVYKELSALTDRDLSDIGISRADISRIAREAA
jgi:uncharacterized protein YjiS (DUF1127 family)